MNSQVIRKRYYLNSARDEVVLNWLNQQSNESEAVRAVLHRYIEGWSGENGRSNTNATDVETLHTTVQAAVTEAMDLTFFRQVVEAAVADALKGLAVSPGPAATTAIPDEFEEAMSEFGQNLLLG